MLAFYSPNFSIFINILLQLVHLERLGSMPEETVRFYVAQLSSALAFLHEMGIMHRFVTPVYAKLGCLFVLLSVIDWVNCQGSQTG
jgi:hypothetical protein